MKSIFIEQCPADWEIVKLGHCLFDYSERVDDEAFPPLSVTYSGILPQLEHVAKSEDRTNRKLVRKGDLVINSRSDRRGASGLSAYTGSVSLINIVMKPRNINSRYFHYVLRSIPFQEEFYRFGHGIVSDLWTTRFSELKGISVCIPSDDEQTKISNFLDKQISVIDQIVSKKLDLIEALKQKEALSVQGLVPSLSRKFDKRKNSSLPWLPSIPEHWELRKAKYIFSNISRPPLKEDKVITAYRDGQITLRENRRASGYTFAIKETGYQHIKKGDLVIHTMDAFAGAIGVSDSDGKSTGEYAVCAPISNATNSDYYAQVLRNMALHNYIYVLCPSVRERAPRFRFSKLAPVLLPVPPTAEQNLIANYINKSRSLRETIMRSILKVEEFKKSLVSQAVTGQIDVNEWSRRGHSDAKLDAIAKEMKA